MAKALLLAMKLNFMVADLAVHEVQQNLFGIGWREDAADELKMLIVFFGHGFHGLQAGQ